MYQEIVEALPWIFAWNDAQPILDAVHTSGLEYANARTQRALEHIGTIDSELEQSMRGCLQALPHRAVCRFITAPETLQRTITLPVEKNPARHISFLCNALMAERALSQEGRGAARPCWTALGDFYFCGGRNDPAVDMRDSTWTASVNGCAPRLTDSVPLDFVSPLAQSATPCKSAFQPYTPEEIKVASNALQDSFTRIGSVKPAAQIITGFAKVIVLRKDKPADLHSSSSMRNYPGRLMLRNPEAADAGALASSMIHESIHHFLYTVEFSGEFVSLEGARVPSPWTGRELALHSYLHACFVWYGLAQFWHKQLTMNVFEPQMIETQLSRALAGFRTANPVDALVPQKSLFRPEPLQAASRLRDELLKIGALDWRESNVA